MSRTIKFRAWLIDKRRMLNWDELTSSEEWSETRFIFAGQVSNSSPVMQWTGFRDSKDVEIYEGDIVRLANDLGDVDVGTVEWDGRYGEWVIAGADDILGYALEGYRVDVIGNRWENPELMQEADEDGNVPT